MVDRELERRIHLASQKWTHQILNAVFIYKMLIYEKAYQVIGERRRLVPSSKKIVIETKLELRLGSLFALNVIDQVECRCI